MNSLHHPRVKFIPLNRNFNWMSKAATCWIIHIIERRMTLSNPGQWPQWPIGSDTRLTHVWPPRDCGDHLGTMWGLSGDHLYNNLCPTEETGMCAGILQKCGSGKNNNCWQAGKRRDAFEPIGWSAMHAKLIDTVFNFLLSPFWFDRF